MSREYNLVYYGMKPSIDNVTFLDYPEPVGHAVSVFFTGCSMNCKDCQNPQLQEEGKVYEALYYDEFILMLREVLKRASTRKVVLMGGDPLHEQNREFTKYLIEQNKDLCFCVYTGYNWDIAKRWVIGARYVKCGGYKPELKQKSEKTETYMQFASSNQELYKQFLGEEYMKISNNGRVCFYD